MPTLLEDCKRLFQTKSLYEVLGLLKEDASKIKAAEIKKAYYTCSLVCHPDRCGPAEKEVATKKFQTLCRVYAILNDKEKRAAYDETGEFEEECINSDENKDWDAYWRLLFKKVTVEDIKKFESKYKNSTDELKDLKSAYLRFKGNMDLIMESVLCCSVLQDEDRFRSILNDLIEKSEIPAFDAFTKEPAKKRLARKRKAEAEAKEAAELRSQFDNDLVNIISKRREQRAQEMDSLLDGLAAKYGAKSAKNTTSKKAKKTD